MWFMNSKPQFQRLYHPGASTEVGMVMQTWKLCSSDFMEKNVLRKVHFPGLAGEAQDGNICVEDERASILKLIDSPQMQNFPLEMPTSGRKHNYSP